MKDFADEPRSPSTALQGAATKSLEELEHNWVRLRWRTDGAMEEGRMARDAHHKRQINRGNFSFRDPADPAAGPLLKVTNGVLSRRP